MERIIQLTEFLKLLAQKERKTIYTFHSIKKARARKIISDTENEVKQMKTDLFEKNADVIAEQTSENPSERKFKLYYLLQEGGFIVYVLSLDGEIRLITTYRTSKSLQKKIYKHVKRS